MRAKRLRKILASIACSATMIAGNVTGVYAEDKVADNYHDKFNELYNSLVTAVQNHDVNALRNIYEPGTSEDELSQIANQEINIDGFNQYPTSYIGAYKNDGAVYMTGYYKVDNKYQSNYSYTYSYSCYYMKRVNGNFYLANSASSDVVTKVFCKNLAKYDEFDDSDPYYYLDKDYKNENIDEDTDKNVSKIWLGDHQPTYTTSKNDAKTDDHIDQDTLSYNYPYSGALHIEPIALWQMDSENAFVLLCFENGINSTNEQYKKDVEFRNIHVEFTTSSGEKVISQDVYYDNEDMNRSLKVDHGSESQKIYFVKLKKDVDSWSDLTANVSFEYQLS